jgi:hypothetical protein
MEQKMSDIRKKVFYVNFNKKAYPDSLEMIEREQDLSINRQKEKNPDKEKYYSEPICSANWKFNKSSGVWQKIVMYLNIGEYDPQISVTIHTSEEQPEESVRFEAYKKKKFGKENEIKEESIFDDSTTPF